ncbi:hypothetical protein EST38_g1341 [Candolleomyces aberdarensis]|uniref:DED domain-containing protein n=1 Tax=Candolleomyces aberdarensis TaxID=2316362 RepID=A0A4Q2DW95_9AGAR|nr:hypothetical protein EST38_g1341 [Candolleomyces aberdarensis]
MSSPLRRVLSSLKTPVSKPWCLVVLPNPNSYHAITNVSSPGELMFHLRLDSNFDLDEYCEANPTFGFAANDHMPNKPLSGKPVSTTTDWIRVISDVNRRSSDGLTVHEVLADLLRQFPRFNLQSAQDAEEAINKIESRLAEVASFKDSE